MDMGNMKQEHYKQIALDFSGGKFKPTYLILIVQMEPVAPDGFL